MQGQRPYRPPVVYRKRDFRQYLLLSCPGLAKKACAIPKAADAALPEQEVVWVPLWEMESSASEAVFSSTPSICLEMQGICVENHEQTGADVIKHTLLALCQHCQATYPMWQNFTWSQATHLFLFCGRRCDRIKNTALWKRWFLPII